MTGPAHPTSSSCVRPGHGASPLPVDPLRAIQFGDLLVEFADALDLRNLVVVGNSVAPVLITWGAGDFTAPLRWGKVVQMSIPGSTLDAFGTGHVVFSSEPAAWLDRVLPFVETAHGAEQRQADPRASSYD